MPKNFTALKYGKNLASSKEICFPLGSKIDIDKIQFTSGGGGTNTAATFSLQGFKTAFCGTVGDDASGLQIINELKKFKIATNFIIKTKKKPTNHSIIVFNEGQDRTILAYRGASELMSKKDIPWLKLKTKWLYLAPLSGLLCDNFEELVHFAFDKKIQVAINPGIAQLSLPNFSDIAKKINVLILNQEEASFLTKIPYENEKDIFKKMQEICPGILIITKGGNGVTVSDGKAIYSAVPPQDRKIVDTTGAGDSFASGFLSEYIKSQDVEKSIQLAMANSVGCLSEVGAKKGLLKKGQEFQRVEVAREGILQ